MYEDPSGLFFKEVWNGIKNTGRKIVNAVKAGGKVLQSAASVAGKKLKEFTSTKEGKVFVGVTVLALAGAATILTGGAGAGFTGSVAYGFLQGAIIGGTLGAATGGTEAVLSNRMQTGSWSGSMQVFTDGAASGFYQGTISSGVTGSIGAGVRYGANALGEVVNPLSKWMKTSTGTSGSTAYKTGTVWDNVKSTQQNHVGSKIPQSFEMTTQNGNYWVHLNATKHMAEYSSRTLSHGKPMIEQQLMSSFQGAVNEASRIGIQYGEMMNVGNWELIFSPARNTGMLPVIKHALYIP